MVGFGGRFKPGGSNGVSVEVKVGWVLRRLEMLPGESTSVRRASGGGN